MISTLLAYDEWAKSRVLACLHNVPADSKALQLMAHLLMAEKIWLERLLGRDTVGADKSPTLTAAECELLSKENQSGFASVLEQFAERMDTQINYRNLSGKEFNTSVTDILTHVMLHGVYHRGQIALAQRTAGNEPVNTDFITFERERSLQN